MQASADATITNSLSLHLQAAANIGSEPAKSTLLAPSSSVLKLSQHAQSHCRGLDQRQTHQQQASREGFQGLTHAKYAQPSSTPVPSAQTSAAKQLKDKLVDDVRPAAAKQPTPASRSAAEVRSAKASAGSGVAKQAAVSRVTRLSRQAPSDSADIRCSKDEKAVQDGSSSSGSDDAYSFQGSSDDEDDAVSDSAAARGKTAGRQTAAQLKSR